MMITTTLTYLARETLAEEAKPTTTTLNVTVKAKNLTAD